jgi:hypothetical protein
MKHNYFPTTSLTNKKYSVKLLTNAITYLLLLFGNFLTAQTATLNVGSPSPWQVSSVVTSINIEAWGAGGAGGAGGGSGSGYTILNNLAVTPLQIIPFIT